jgi:phage-related protein
MAGPLDEAFVEITAELNTRQLIRTATTAGKAVEKNLTAGVRRAEKSMSRQGTLLGKSAGDGFSSGLSNALSSLTGIKLPTAGFAVLAPAIAAAAGAAVQFAAALAPAVGIVATLPSGIGVLAAGMTTLNVATAGVGDAFGAAFGTAEEFESEMEGLAPSVQAAAQVIRDMAPALEELRNSVQQEFFAGFDAILLQLSETLLGPVTTGMVSVAGSINGIITGLAAVATSAQSVELVNQSFAIMSEILAGLAEPLAMLFGSLLNVGSAINSAFGEGAGAGLANLITQFADFLNKAAESGQAVGWVRDAQAVFQALGDIIAPIASIISSIGEAAQTTGGNILGVFGEALATVSEFFASAAGQDALITVFEALNQVGAAFSTVLAGLAPAIVPLVSGLSSIFAAVSPLLGPLSELVGSVLAALAPILGVVASAITPLIGPITTIVTLLGGILTEALTAVMPIIELLSTTLSSILGPVLEVIGAVLQALAPIFDALFATIGPIVEALAPLYEILGVVAEIVGTVLQPVIQVLGDILLWLVNNVVIPILVPAIETMAEVMSVLLSGAIDALVDKFELAWQGLGILFEWLKSVFEEKFNEMKTAFEVLKFALKAGWDFIKNNFINPAKAGFQAFKESVSTVLTNTKDGFNSFVSFVKGIPGKISGALSDMFAPLASGFRSAINSVISGWNNLSFSIPSVDIPGVGTVGGGTINTPNIPYLARGGMPMGPTLAMIGEGRSQEVVLPLEDPRVTNLLASALGRAGVAANANGGSQGVQATGSMGDMFPSFVVKIGERELKDIIVEQQNQSNADMLRRARVGTARRA